MRELYVKIDEALNNGMRPEDHSPRNAPFLYDCFGVRVGKVGLEELEALVNPIPDTVDMHYDWPFPQFLKSEEYRLLVVRDEILGGDAIYSLNEDYSTATFVDLVDELTYGQGTLMEVADFGRYVFMTNGVAMLYYDIALAAWAIKTSIATIPMLRTVCNFKGQMIGGCVLSNWPAVEPQCDEKFIVWSDIGSVNFIPDRKNTAGYRRDPYGGEVYHVRRLRDHVVVYSSQGITRMYPVGKPSATFGFKELHDTGLVNRGAMGGGLNEHVFVDSDYFVWKVEENQINKLGYQEYMEELDAGDVVVNYNADKGDYYISDGVTTFLLSPKGLSRHTEEVSAAWFDRSLYGLPASTEDVKPYIVSDVIDMGYRGQKTIFSVEVSGDEAEVAIDYRYKTSEDFQRTNFVPTNNEGVVSIIAAGIEFRVVAKSTELAYYQFDLDYIIARWKMTDLRGLRGIYAPPPRGQ